MGEPFLFTRVDAMAADLRAGRNDDGWVRRIQDLAGDTLPRFQLHGRERITSTRLLEAEPHPFSKLDVFADTKINTLGAEQGQRRPLDLCVFENVFLAFTNTGFCLFDRDGVYEHSTAVPNFDIKTVRVSEEFHAGMFPGDMFLGKNICHKTVDQVGRALLFVTQVGRNRVPIVVPPRRLDYNRFIDERALGFTVELTTNRVFAFSKLMLLSSSLYPIEHPARYGDRRILDPLRQRVRPTVQDDLPKKIFIDRRDATAKSRNIEDEAQLWGRLQAEGFHRVTMSDLPPQQQVQLFRSADVIVSAHGAGLTSIAFCRPGTRVVEMFSPEKGTAAYTILARALELDYHPILGRPVGAEKSFVVEEEAVMQAVNG